MVKLQKRIDLKLKFVETELGGGYFDFDKKALLEASFEDLSHDLALSNLECSNSPKVGFSSSSLDEGANET